LIVALFTNHLFSSYSLSDGSQSIFGKVINNFLNKSNKRSSKLELIIVEKFGRFENKK